MVVLFDAHATTDSPNLDHLQQVHDPAARLVGIGFRSWYLGSETGDISNWEAGWHYFTNELGRARANRAVTELACWVRAVRQHALRPIRISPLSSDGFNADERLAISLVAASQQGACPVLVSCAYALLGNDDTEEVINTAQGLAHVLSGAQVRVGAGSRSCGVFA